MCSSEGDEYSDNGIIEVLLKNYQRIRVTIQTRWDHEIHYIGVIENESVHNQCSCLCVNYCCDTYIILPSEN